MRLLFSADWHIKIKKKNIPKDWAINRYRMLFSELHNLTTEGIDLHIIGGDIFDTMPTLEELTLFLEFVSGVNINTIIYDGNHEATKRGETFLIMLKKMVASINGKVKILDGIQDIHGIDFIPYTHIKTFNPKDFHNPILCTHVRGNIPPHVKEEIDLKKLKRWDVVLAGDLHANSNSQLNILYPGSPLSTSFHRSTITNGVILFDSISMVHTFISLGLPQLLRKTVDKETDMVPTSPNHTIYELVGNTIDVANIENELLDKKIVEKDSEATLNLANKSIEEELLIYFRDVMKLKTEQAEEVMGVHNDYT